MCRKHEVLNKRQYRTNVKFLNKRKNNIFFLNRRKEEKLRYIISLLTSISTGNH